MRQISFLIFLLAGLNLSAQEKIMSTDHFSVEGLVKNPFTVSLESLRSYKAYAIDSLPISNHLMQKKYTLHQLKGILLKDILTKSDIDAATPKELSEFYIVCVASDNYKVVFSWNELFNSKTGEKVYILTEVDGKPVTTNNDRITLASTSDMATGRRFVKGLEKIIVERVK